jgi:predicted Zn-dependent peptidase
LLLPHRNETFTSSIFFYFKVGSKNELLEINGISHFVEHMIFKGSPKFKSYLDISKTFDANGISFNAFTSKDMTVYHYKFLSSPENLDIICKITSDMILHPLMREKDILTERNVIKQELQDDADDIDEFISDNIENKIFEGHPLERTIIGTIETLDNIQQKELLEFHNKYYRKDNLLITFSGNMKNTYTNIINKYFSKSNSNLHKFIQIDIKQREPSTIIPYQEKQHSNVKDKDKDKDKYKYNTNNKLSTIYCYPKKLKQDHIHIIFKTRGTFDTNYYNNKLLRNILGGNMSSRLFIEIREKLGLVYTVNCSITNYEEAGFFSINTQNEHKDTLKCITEILQELKKIKGHANNNTHTHTHSITEQELKETQKNYCDILASNFDDIEFENEFYSKQLLYNKSFETMSERIDKFNNITVKDLTDSAIQLFDFTKMYILTFGKETKENIQRIVNKI